MKFRFLCHQAGFVLSLLISLLTHRGQGKDNKPFPQESSWHYSMHAHTLDPLVRVAMCLETDCGVRVCMDCRPGHQSPLVGVWLSTLLLYKGAVTSCSHPLQLKSPDSNPFMVIKIPWTSKFIVSYWPSSLTFLKVKIGRFHESNVNLDGKTN